MLRVLKPILILFCFLFLLYLGYDSHALVRSSDRLSSSSPGIGADHGIRFGVFKDIPAGGFIEVVIDGEFTIPMDFDYDDIDLAVSATYNGTYSDRNLSNVALPSTEIVSIATSVVSSIITFELNSGTGILAGEFVEIELGENAIFGRTGSSTQIVNPSSTGSKSIDIRVLDDTNNLISKSQVPVFIILPVTMTSDNRKARSGASPVGWLGYGTTESIMSIYTNFPSVCRYAITEGVAYDDMVDEFAYMIPGLYNSHTVSIDGFTNGGSYEYYVRCQDEFSVSDDSTLCVYEAASTTPFSTASGTPILQQDCVDMPIKFSISSIAGSVGGEQGEGGGDTGENSEGSGGSGGSGGGSGGGKGDEKGNDKGDYLPYPPPLGAPGVVLEGWGFPMSFVQILQDGASVGWTNSGNTGEFAVYLEDLIRGMYTFGVWSNDLDSRRSGTYSTTFWIEEGTQSIVSDIIIPPTFEISTSSDSSMQAFGYSTPGANVDIWVYPRRTGEIDASLVQNYNAIVPSSGKWSTNVDLTGLSNGNYYIKARTVIEGLSPSEFSQIFAFTKNGDDLSEEEGGVCSGADLNKDGKVNITDFSILLFYWGTDNACADQNSSGNVDLIDFSIMMYYWTG